MKKGEDFHAITSANNLLAALLDNHIQQGNELGIDTRQIVWKRCLDMNDRVLRNVVVGDRKSTRKGFTSNRAFYDYSLRTVREKTHEGHRYTSMCALSVIAWKCKVPDWELEKDLESLLPDFNKGAVRTVKATEINSAMKMYNARAMETPRERLEDWLGWEYKPIKRNGLKREQHLYLARRRKEDMKVMKIPMKGHEGRPTKEHIVKEYLAQHPNATKTDVVRNTGLSYDTVRKYWGKE